MFLHIYFSSSSVSYLWKNAASIKRATCWTRSPARPRAITPSRLRCDRNGSWNPTGKPTDMRQKWVQRLRLQSSDVRRNVRRRAPHSGWVAELSVPTLPIEKHATCQAMFIQAALGGTYYKLINLAELKCEYRWPLMSNPDHSLIFPGAILSRGMVDNSHGWPLMTMTREKLCGGEASTDSLMAIL